MDSAANGLPDLISLTLQNYDGKMTSDLIFWKQNGMLTVIIILVKSINDGLQMF